MAWKNYKRHYHNRRLVKKIFGWERSRYRYYYENPDVFEYFGDEKLKEATYTVTYPTYTRVFVPDSASGHWETLPDGGTRSFVGRNTHRAHNLLTQEEVWELQSAQKKHAEVRNKKRLIEPWRGHGVKSARRRGDTIFGGNRNLDRNLFIQGKYITEEEFDSMNLSGWHGCSYWD
jgi:hypothetical protein